MNFKDRFVQNAFWNDVGLVEMLMLKCFTINLVVLIFCHYSYLTNGLHFSLKNKKVLLFFTRCDVFCDLLQYTHTEKCNLFVLYNKNSSGLLKDLGSMKKEKPVCWRDLTWIWRHLCVCPSIDHGRQPMKMHTEVTLLYNLLYFRCTTMNKCTNFLARSDLIQLLVSTLM